ncbi:M48 family metallopeptidase, partial [Mycobacterium tuberculosis]|nr:M48 family metallopeptidase [Mycobacterium tuberculosis]
YLAAHEVAHLRELNHSARFWRLVAGLCPSWKHERDWLKRNGNRLHGYGPA